MLGDAPDALGIGLYKLQVFLFGRFAEGAEQPALGGDETVLDQDAEIAFEGWQLFQEQFPGGMRDQQQLAVFEGFDIQKRRLTRKKTIEIGRPPAFQGKLKDMFAALFIDGICPQQTLADEDIVFGDIPFLQDKLLFSQFFWGKEGFTKLELLRCQCDLLVDLSCTNQQPDRKVDA